MLILMKIEEYIRKRKKKNQEVAFNSVQEAIRQIDLDINGSDGAISAVAAASNYETMHFTICKILRAAEIGIRREKSKEAKKYYSQSKVLFGYLKFVLDFYGGVLGIFWL